MIDHRSLLWVMLLLVTGCQTPGSDADRQPPDELQQRIEKSRHRLVEGALPAFTKPFVLADVTLSSRYPRRFSNFSGDLSGRYLSALSALPPSARPDSLPVLAADVLREQRPDGRFGDASLVFEADAIGREHMALLWGNGRLLVGLLDYHAAYPSADVLAAARRLGDFLLTTVEAASRPDVAERLKDFGAYGFICFTQLNEGLSLLSERTGDQTYTEAAARISTWLLPPGNQHTHGYLTTLRGMLHVYEQTQDPQHLAFVEERYADLVQSDAYLTYGGVPEYFGSYQGDTGRDEGCSEADFVGLSFQLWEATGKADYLDRAEHALMNHLFFNQFESGDFGHHTFKENRNAGFALTGTTSKAWWCCTMHGLRYMIHAQQRIVTREADVRKVNLYFRATWADEALQFRLEKTSAYPDPVYALTITAASGEAALALRVPPYVDAMEVRVNGRPVEAAASGGYLTLRRPWREGDRVTVEQVLSTRIITPEGRRVRLEDVGREPLQGYLFHGPYLLGADGALEPAFVSEPEWGNVILVRPQPDRPERAVLGETTMPEAYLRFAYRHDGFFGVQPVVLRPISELTYGQRANVTVAFTFQAAG